MSESKVPSIKGSKVSKLNGYHRDNNKEADILSNKAYQEILQSNSMLLHGYRGAVKVIKKSRNNS
jgi:hypothetical protein